LKEEKELVNLMLKQA